MNPFDQAWALLKEYSPHPEKINIDNCDSCFQNAPLAELETPHVGGVSHLCERCWKEEMDWRLQQQQGDRTPANPDLDEFGASFGITGAGEKQKEVWPDHLVPIIPWPYPDGDSDLRGLE